MTIYVRPEVLPAWAESGDKIQPLDSQIQSGWVMSEIPPARQRFNWAMNYNANGVRYLTQRGIPEWNADEDYPIGACVIYSGLTYKSVLANTNKQPNTNPSEWDRWALTSAELGSSFLQKSLNLSDVANTATALANLGGINSGFVYAITGTSGATDYRNKIINGNFDIWQRNTTFSNPANAAYTADRWCVATGGTVGTFTVSRQNFAVGDSIRTQSSYYIQWSQTVAGSASTRRLVQKIEDVRTLSNGSVTISFLAWAATATDITVALTQAFGSGGSPSADVTQTSSTITLSTSPTVYTVTLALPSITGKTIGTSINSSSLNLEFRLPLSSTFTVNLSAVQVESGTVSTPYVVRHIQDETSLCQRYYERGILWAQSYTTNGSPIAMSAPYKIDKRNTAAITTSNIVYVNATGLTISPSSFSSSSWIVGQVTATGTTNCGFTCDFTAEAEL